MARIFPVTVVVLQAAAGIVYAVSGDWRRAVIWTAVAVANLALTM